MYDKNLVHESDAITTTSTSDANHHHKTTNIHNIYNVEKRSTSSASRQYLNQQLQDDDAHALSREQLQQLRQAYSMEELPRVTRLNDQEVQSVDSALLTADEQDLIDSSIEEERLSSAYRRYVSRQLGQSVGWSVDRFSGQFIGWSHLGEAARCSQSNCVDYLRYNIKTIGTNATSELQHTTVC